MTDDVMVSLDGAAPSPRLASIDAYRGWVMILMQAEALRLCAVAAGVPDSWLWGQLCYEQSHTQWAGMALHDFIMPSFAFLIGVAMPFSLAARQARGQSFAHMARHTIVRSVVLVLLGVAIASAHPRTLTWAFEDILPQVGFGYVFLFLLGFCRSRYVWVAIAAILIGDWLAFALHPLPQPGFDYASVGVPQAWLDQYGLHGFAAHWQKNSNLGWRVDTWFLNLFPRHAAFRFNPEGYATLNFIPLLGTMLLGLLAGRVLMRDWAPRRKIIWFIAAAAACMTVGWVGAVTGVCPIVKRLWTPGWTLWSGGWCFLALAAWYVAVDLWRMSRLAFPFTVVGLNSITAYCMAQFYPAFAFNGLSRLVGRGPFRLFGPAFEPVVYGSAILACYWVVLYVMYRRRMVVRI
jgi:heparan-alpha-glucosaminide N-acetyltransferase